MLSIISLLPQPRQPQSLVFCHLPLLLLLVPQACVAQAKVPNYFCDTPGRQYIESAEFYLHTRLNRTDRYQPGRSCVFYASSSIPNALYFVQFVNISMPTATLTLSSGPSDFLMLTFGRVQSAPFAAVTSTNYTLTVSFLADNSTNSGNSSTGGIGAILRVRRFVGCPPDWFRSGNFCFGNAGSSAPVALRRLSFSASQAACRAMRANLFHMPAGAGQLPPSVKGLADIYRQLPNYLSVANWIGLTDYTTDGQFNYYWLDGSGFYDSGLISCGSSYLGNYRNCKIDERCAYLITNMLYPLRFVVMDRCNSERDFTCAMPVGGAQSYYKVPAYSIFSPGAWAWAMVIGCLFAIGVAIGVAYAVMRLCHSRRRRDEKTRATAGLATTAKAGDGNNNVPVFTIEDEKL